MDNLLRPTTVKTNLIRLLKLKKWSVADLEKKIGGTRNINNIIRGNSKYPTVELVHKIATAFNVDIKELLYEYNEEHEYSKINHSLLLECFVETTNSILAIEKKHNITVNNLLFLVGEVYKYSNKLEIDYVDKEFIKWVISKYYSS